MPDRHWRYTSEQNREYSNLVKITQLGNECCTLKACLLLSLFYYSGYYSILFQH